MKKYCFKIKRKMIFFLHKNCPNKLDENLKAKDKHEKKKMDSIRLNQSSNYTHKMIYGSSKTIKKSLYILINGSKFKTKLKIERKTYIISTSILFILNKWIWK